MGTLIRPSVQPELGFDIYSRSSTMMSLPFDDDEDMFSPPDMDNDEAASFLSMMPAPEIVSASEPPRWRSKLMILVNCGPGTTTLTLTPKAITDEEPQRPELKIAPGMLCVFAMDRRLIQLDLRAFRLVFRALWSA